MILNLIALASSQAVLYLMTRALAVVSSSSSDRVYPFLNSQSPLPLFSLDSYSTYAVVNISLKNSSRFLTSMHLLFNLLRRIVEPNPFLLCSPFLQNFFLFWGTSIVMIVFATKEVLQTLVGKKHSIGSFYLLFINPDSPTFLHRASGSRSYPKVSFDSSFPALGWCFQTWALITFQFFLPSFFLHSPSRISVLLYSTSRKLVRMTLLFINIHTVFLQRNTSFFSIVILFSSLALNAVKSSTPFGRNQHQPQAWWPFDVGEAEKERLQAFDFALKMVKSDRLTSQPLGLPCSVIAKVKAKL